MIIWVTSSATCDEVSGDTKHNSCFLGIVTSNRALGILIKGINSVTIINVDNPDRCLF